MHNVNDMTMVLRRALASHTLIDEDDTALVFYDLTALEGKVRELTGAFPDNTLHAVAVKANPLLENLKFMNNLGTGAEAASLSEIHLALQAGFSPSSIIFDSPAKTKNEIHFALEKGIHLNADSFNELETIRGYLQTHKSNSRIGVRINPEVGAGTISETSVAGQTSKFGIPITLCRKELQKYFLENEWIRGVHVHIGSQGMSLDQLCKGTKVVYDFALESNDLRVRNHRDPVNQFDIGGGLAVSYNSHRKAASITDYSSELQRRCPRLFSKQFHLITEFGRYVYANSGWAVCKIEGLKKMKGITVATTHLGADMFVREAYMPDKWHHEICVLDKFGGLKKGKRKRYVLAGPLCFAGDVIKKNVLLPEIEIGDYAMVMDVGAYTTSMWSRYNSRQMPKIIGYTHHGKQFTILKQRESIEKVIEFWR